MRNVLEEHDRVGSYDTPEYERAEAVFNARHFYRGDADPPELERMLPERGRESYRAMWGPNEWTLTGALRGWDVRPRLHELDVPALVIRRQVRPLDGDRSPPPSSAASRRRARSSSSGALTLRCSRRRSGISRSSAAS